MKPILIKNGKVFIKNKLQEKDILILNKKIIKIEKNIKQSNCDVIDASNLYVIPGLIDVHVHLREPGFEYKETIATGTKAAAKGGFCSICAMPNLNPKMDTVKSLQKQISLINKHAIINVLPYSTITKLQTGISPLVDFVKNAKYCFAFSDDGIGVKNNSTMEQAMLNAKKLDKHIVAHCEDLTLVNGGIIHNGPCAKKYHLKTISSESEFVQVKRDVKLVKKIGCKYHVCHISTTQSLEIIKKAKSKLITCEVTPHHLLLNNEMVQNKGVWKVNPPLRTEKDRLSLVSGIKNKIISLIATDHAPHGNSEKANDLIHSPFGFVGLETSLPLIFTNFVANKKITLKDMIELMSFNAHKIFNLPNNSIEVGNVVNICIFDPCKYTKINAKKFVSKCKVSPFDGWNCTGWNKYTICNGKIVYKG